MTALLMIPMVLYTSCQFEAPPLRGKGEETQRETPTPPPQKKDEKAKDSGGGDQPETATSIPEKRDALLKALKDSISTKGEDDIVASFTAYLQQNEYIYACLGPIKKYTALGLAFPNLVTKESAQALFAFEQKTYGEVRCAALVSLAKLSKAVPAKFAPSKVFEVLTTRLKESAKIALGVRAANIQALSILIGDGKDTLWLTEENKARLLSRLVTTMGHEDNALRTAAKQLFLQLAPDKKTSLAGADFNDFSKVLDALKTLAITDPTYFPAVREAMFIHMGRYVKSAWINAERMEKASTHFLELVKQLKADEEHENFETILSAVSEAASPEFVSAVYPAFEALAMREPTKYYPKLLEKFNAGEPKKAYVQYFTFRALVALTAHLVTSKEDADQKFFDENQKQSFIEVLKKARRGRADVRDVLVQAIREPALKEICLQFASEKPIIGPMIDKLSGNTSMDKSSLIQTLAQTMDWKVPITKEQAKSGTSMLVADYEPLRAALYKASKSPVVAQALGVLAKTTTQPAARTKAVGCLLDLLFDMNRFIDCGKQTRIAAAEALLEVCEARTKEMPETAGDTKELTKAAFGPLQQIAQAVKAKNRNSKEICDGLGELGKVAPQFSEIIFQKLLFSDQGWHLWTDKKNPNIQKALEEALAAIAIHAYDKNSTYYQPMSNMLDQVSCTRSKYIARSSPESHAIAVIGEVAKNIKDKERKTLVDKLIEATTNDYTVEAAVEALYKLANASETPISGNKSVIAALETILGNNASKESRSNYSSDLIKLVKAALTKIKPESGNTAPSVCKEAE